MGLIFIFKKVSFNNTIWCPCFPWAQREGRKRGCEPSLCCALTIFSCCLLELPWKKRKRKNQIWKKIKFPEKAKGKLAIVSCRRLAVPEKKRKKKKSSSQKQKRQESVSWSPPSGWDREKGKRVYHIWCSFGAKMPTILSFLKGL